MKKINRACLERSKQNLIVSIHDKAVPKTKIENKRSNAGLVVRGGRVTSLLTGSINK